MTILYLIRHCEAFGNCQRVFQGHLDGDISELGHKQLERLSARFADTPLDAVYSSPLLRARKTAEAVAEPHGLPVTLDERLMEIHGGHWEGQPWSRLPALFPEESEHWAKRPWLFAPQGGESMRQVYERMSEALCGIASRHPGGAVAVASHGCAIRNAICWAKGWPLERVGEVDWCDNTAVTVIAFDEEGHPRILRENDNSHLNGDTSRFGEQTWWKAGADSPFD